MLPPGAVQTNDFLIGLPIVIIALVANVVLLVLGGPTE
jgi:hypothetical protein